MANREELFCDGHMTSDQSVPQDPKGGSLLVCQLLIFLTQDFQEEEKKERRLQGKKGEREKN